MTLFELFKLELKALFTNPVVVLTLLVAWCFILSSTRRLTPSRSP